MAGNFFDGKFFDGGFFGENGAQPTGGGALWAKGRGALNLKPRRRPLTYSETQELAERLQAIAAAQAAASIPMEAISEDGHVIGDSEIEDDDMILQAMILRVLH